MMGFLVNKVVVSVRLLVIENYAKTNNSLAIRKKQKIKQEEIINWQYFVFHQF